MTVDAMTTALAIDRFTPALQGIFANAHELA
jgi:hypothetical protein